VSHKRYMTGLFVLSLILLCCATLLLRAQEPEETYRVDSTLRMLSVLRAQPYVPASVRQLLQEDKVGVTIRFQRGFRLESASLMRLEKELGIEFARQNGQVVEFGQIRSAQVPWDALDQLAAWPGVERVDSVWKPAVAAPLDVSIPEIGANQVWTVLDAAGHAVTGQGVVVASFDTGIDVFHPDFWRADGGSFAWLDVNGNSLFDPGLDAVDLNKNGLADPGETLRLLDSSSSLLDAIPGTNDGIFHPDTDWLYNDANGNGLRDFGPTHGFTETAPAFGEMLFVAEDSNHDGLLSNGEALLALGTSKVQKVLGPLGVEYRRGTNLIFSPADGKGHGTQVASILAGGSLRSRRYVGVAPDLTLLLADCWANDYSTYVPWAEQNGAQVMLYEFGSWVQEFLDGSSNLEQMLDRESAKGIVQVAPAGNLADGSKHAHPVLSTVAPHSVRFVVPPGGGIREAYLSILWHGPTDALNVELITPSGTVVTLPGNGTITSADGHAILSSLDHSVRETSRFDIHIDHGGAPLAENNWTLRLRNNLSYGLSAHAYAYDPDHDWSGGVMFLDSVDSFSTVTAPATADSAIAVASYATRGRGGDLPGVLSSFSGMGPRIDGEEVLDVAAPGHYADIACASSKDVAGATIGEYAWFGGTSAAAAHVAGAVALLRQARPYLRPADITQWLQVTARQDVNTGIVPNENWGWGKLDVAAALAAIPTPTATPPFRIFLPILLRDW
jgi:subtilisin family serine protease